MPAPKLSDIKLFGHAWPHDYFTHKGVRGWWLRLLNRLRYWLEARVNWHATYILQRDGIDLDTQRRLWEDDQRRPVHTFTDTFETVHQTAPTIEQFSSSPFDVVGAVNDTNTVIARLTQGKRLRRYTKARRNYSMYEADEQQLLKQGEPNGGSETEALEGTNHQ